MPKLEILQGIPLSGKSTYAAARENYKTIILSRDELRIGLFDLKRYNDYVFSKENENKVTEKFNLLFNMALDNNLSIIIDNTNLKPGYYQSFIDKAKSYNYEIEIVKFPISFVRAGFRNIIRRIKTGKWIPWKVMRDMKKAYDKLQKQQKDESKHLVHL